MSDSAGGEVLFEITLAGGSAKVVAIDAASGIEVMVICPSNTPRYAMQQAGINKLRYVLEKRKRGNAPEVAQTQKEIPDSSGPGTSFMA